jgi:DbpA-like RNA binding protein
VTGLVEARAALERGRSVIVVAPPGVEHADAVWALLRSTLTPGASLVAPGCVIVCGDPATAVEWADVAPADRRVHPVTGLARTQRVLQSSPPDIVAGAAGDLAALVSRSALKLEGVHSIIVAWPEALPAEHGELLDALLAEAREARRIVLTWDPSRTTGFLERHAHRAPMVGSPALDAEGRPAPPLGPARFTIVARDRRRSAIRPAIEALEAARAFVWRRGTALPTDPVDAVLCVDLPNREEFAQLSELAEPTLFLAAAQVPYARSIASPLTALSLPSEADVARDRAQALRAEVARRLDNGNVDAELALLDPLFGRYDPAEVAAALLAIRRQTSDVGPPPPASATPTEASGPSWAKVFVGVGKKDRASAKDLVGALIREAGLAKEEIGRIDVRETFSLVEVAPAAVEKAVRGLGGATIRGRRLTVRRDRDR